MDFDLQRMLVKTINVRRITAKTSGGNETLGAAIPVLAHVEQVDAEAEDQGGTEQTINHLIVTQVQLFQTDRIFLPGLDPSNVNLGKHPLGAVKVFYDPDTGVADHWEVTV